MFYLLATLVPLLVLANAQPLSGRAEELSKYQTLQPKAFGVAM